MADEGVATAAVAAEEETTVPFPSDHKIKAEDLKAEEAPELDFSNPPPDEIPAEPEEEPNAISNGVEISIKKEEETAVELPDSPEAKRPRLEEEIDGSGKSSHYLDL